MRSKEIKFVRHYKLAYPFDHWTNMSLDQFISFNEGFIDPEIDPSVNDYLSQNQNDLANYQVIYSGTKNRTIQTASVIKNHFEMKITIVHELCFDEIPWKFIEKPTSEEFEEIKKNQRLAVRRVRSLGEKTNN